MTSAYAKYQDTSARAKAGDIEAAEQLQADAMAVLAEFRAHSLSDEDHATLKEAAAEVGARLRAALKGESYDR
ncbi:hypothetical protein ABNQ39_20490 [Azospirillum sp. A26]|uniref:hypothetical protein n=1 Tax=Azospirillum sp. A26 TaxID=3160607 RepID=UPI003670C449